MLTTERVWETFGESMRSFIRKRIANPEDAEDILQEVFLKIHTGLSRLQDEERLAPWLYRIARHAIIDHYRSQQALEALPEELPVEAEASEANPAEEIAAGLRMMIGCLPEKYRQALVWTELEGMKQTELAHNLGMSASGAKSRVQRGREMLRQELLDCCQFEFDQRGAILDYSPRADCCEGC